MECSSRPIRGEIASAATPPQRRMSPLSTLGKAKEPLLGEEHRDADTTLLQSRLATTTAENAPSNPEASYPRADPSTPHGGGIRSIASCIKGVPWFLGGRSLLLVCWALLVVSHRSWLAGSFVGSWLRSLDSGLWVRVPPWWVVLERSSWGSPFPSTGSELHKCESVKPHEAARYPTKL